MADKPKMKRKSKYTVYFFCCHVTNKKKKRRRRRWRSSSSNNHSHWNELRKNIREVNAARMSFYFIFWLLSIKDEGSLSILNQKIRVYWHFLVNMTYICHQINKVIVPKTQVHFIPLVVTFDLSPYSLLLLHCQIPFISY